MKKLACLGLMLSLVLIVVLAVGCTPFFANEGNPELKIKGELVVIKFQGYSAGAGYDKYWLFVDGQEMPIGVNVENTQILYDSKIINPTVEYYEGEDVFNRSAKVWFKDKAQFREYLK